MTWKKKDFKFKTSHMSLLLRDGRAMADTCFGLQHFH